MATFKNPAQVREILSVYTKTQIAGLLGELRDEIGAVATGLEPAGNWDASTGSFPEGAAKGTYYLVSTAGTVDGEVFAIGDWLIPLADDADIDTYEDFWVRGDYSKVVPKVYDDVAALVASNDPARGEGALRETKDGRRYEEVTTGEDLTNAVGVKLAEIGYNFSTSERFKAAITRGATYPIGASVVAGGETWQFLDDGNTVEPGLTGWRPATSASLSKFLGASPAVSSDDPAAGSGGVACMVDSLTNGAAGSSFRPHLAAMLRGARGGSGGIGYASISFSPVSPTELGIQTGGNWVGNMLSATTWGSRSLDGKGYYISGGTELSSDFLTLVPDYGWKKLRVLFLKGPNSTSFRLRINGEFGDYGRTVDCYAASYEVGYYDLELHDVSGGVISISHPIGDVFVQGVRLLVEDDDVYVSDLGVGGRTLAAFANQNATLQQEWLSAIGFGALLLDGGMNDRNNSVTAAEHKANLEKVVDDWQAALPNAAAFIIQSNEPDDTATTPFLSYAPKKREVAAEKGVGYIDVRDVFGDYAASVARGLISDGTHPNAKGDKVRAAHYFKHVLPYVLRRRQAVYASSEFSAGSDLPDYYADNVSGSTVVYKIGLQGDGTFRYGQIELDIRANLAGGAAFKRSLFTANIQGSNQAGYATQVRTATETVLHNVASGGGASIGFSVSFSTVGGHVELAITPTAAANLFVTGRVVRMSGTANGPFVYLY